MPERESKRSWHFVLLGDKKLHGMTTAYLKSDALRIKKSGETEVRETMRD